MARVQGMDLNKKTAIMVASAEPIRDLLREMVDEAAKRTRYLAGKVTTQAMVNGLILWLGARLEEDRARVVDEALKLIAAVEQDAMTVDDAVSRSGVSVVERPAAGAFWGGDESGSQRGERPGDDVSEGFKGQERSIGVRRKTPRSK